MIRNKLNPNKLIANDDNIQKLVESEIRRLGLNADLNHIDVSRVTSMTRLFDRSNFNGDISKWNVSSVENMGSMFYGSMFNGDISKWDVSNVINMWEMFSFSKFNGDISKWNISKVGNTGIMFFESDFKGDISDWKFNPNMVIDAEMGLVLERSHEARSIKESELLKEKIKSVKKVGLSRSL